MEAVGIDTANKLVNGMFVPGRYSRRSFQLSLCFKSGIQTGDKNLLMMFQLIAVLKESIRFLSLS